MGKLAYRSLTGAEAQTVISVKTEAADKPDVAALVRLSDQIAAEMYLDSGRHSFDAKEYLATDSVILVL